MDFTELTIKILTGLKDFAGSYGMAIILLTVIVRVALLPLNVSQQRSMKQMQKLGPKLKLLQDKYKNNPQVMQQKMMEFYKENKFNPLGGCLPLLLQMPVFILLYTTLISIPFLIVAGQSSFWFIDSLDETLQTHAGPSQNGVFMVKKDDRFISNKHLTVTLNDGKVVDASLQNDRQPIYNAPIMDRGEVKEQLELGIPLDRTNLVELGVNYQDVKSIETFIANDKTKELEKLTFSTVVDVPLEPDKPGVKTTTITTNVPIEEGTNSINFDVVILILAFAATMMLSQKVLMSKNATMTPEQEQMQKTMGTMMPIMIVVMFVIIPIPAGVFLYMVTSNVLTMGLTAGINKYLDIQDDKSTNSNKTHVTKDVPSDAIEVDAKEKAKNNSTKRLPNNNAKSNTKK